MRKPKDHEERIEAARTLALWMLGDGSWADMLVNAYFEPAQAVERVEREKAAYDR